MSGTFDVVVIGGGQAGIAVGHHLKEAGLNLVVVDENPRVGDAWRHRWDSLRLFTPADVDGMPGERYPAPPWSFPSHTEFADYLEDYVARTGIPVRMGARVRRLAHSGEGFSVEVNDDVLLARAVVVASGFDRVPRVAAFAAELDPAVVQLTTDNYRTPTQVPEGRVLVVGAGNSGAEIALDLAPTHEVYLSGRHPGELPWRVTSPLGRPLGRAVFWAFGHVLTVSTPLGRRARTDLLVHSGPLIRLRSRDLTAAGVTRVGRVVGVDAGQPRVADGELPEVSSVVWCIGFDPDDSWIDLPVFAADGSVRQVRGVSDDVPGLFFLGRLFQYSLASSMIHGVVRDAADVAKAVTGHVRSEQPSRAA